MQQLTDKYLPYWPVLAAALLFFILGFCWRLAVSRAMERTPKSPDWVRRYQTGGFPFGREILGSPKICWWALLLTASAAAAFAAARLANTGMIYLKTPDLFYHSRYGFFLLLLCVVGAGSAYCLLQLLFDRVWAALPGALLFSASVARGHGEGCFLALSLLFLLLYLRAEKPGFPAELLYLAAVLSLAPMIALRQSLVWVLLCYPPIHWCKLISQARNRKLSGWQLIWSILAALIVWPLFLILAALLQRFQMYGFRFYALSSGLAPQRLRLSCSRLLKNIGASLFAVPTRGMLIDLMVDAPLFGMGFWGCCSAWILAKKRRDIRGVFCLVVLAVLLLTWLITGRYALTLGLTLTAVCTLREADIAGKRIGTVLVTAFGICWYLLIQIAAWYLPLTPGLVERLV